MKRILLPVALLAVLAFSAVAVAATFTGTEGNDTILGTEAPDTINGLGGNDLLVGALVGLGLLGRVLLRRPWTVEARQLGDARVYEWKAQGWRASEELCHSVAQQLEATGLPAGGALRPAR